MQIEYTFYYYGDDGPSEEFFYFDTDLYDYIEENYSLDELTDLYIEHVWIKPDVQKSFKDEFDISSEEELRSYINYMGDDSWIIDELIDVLGEDYFYDDVDTKKFYEEEAYDEFLSDLEVRGIEVEDEHRYNYDRHYY